MPTDVRLPQQRRCPCAPLCRLEARPLGARRQRTAGHRFRAARLSSWNAEAIDRIARKCTTLAATSASGYRQSSGAAGEDQRDLPPVAALLRPAAGRQDEGLHGQLQPVPRLPADGRARQAEGLSRQGDRGLPAASRSSADEGAQPCKNEAFQASLELPGDDPDVKAGKPLHGSNQWPDNLPGFREAVLDYHTTMTGFAGLLASVVARGLR